MGEEGREAAEEREKAMNGFQILVLVFLFVGIVSISANLQLIYRRLGNILDEMTGEAQRTRDEIDFYDPNRGKD